jgi:hypothetical protein
MAELEKRDRTGFFGDLLREEARFLPRLGAVFRFDPAVYAEIEADPAALPPSFVVVIGTALLAGLGAPSLAGIFLAIAQAILYWGIVAALVWGIASLLSDEPIEYATLLRCLGFAYAWFAVSIGASLPGIGGLVQWAALGLWAVALVQATRQATRLPTERAVGVCAAALAVALLLPLLVLVALA